MTHFQLDWLFGLFFWGTLLAMIPALRWAVRKEFEADRERSEAMKCSGHEDPEERCPQKSGECICWKPANR